MSDIQSHYAPAQATRNKSFSHPSGQLLPRLLRQNSESHMVEGRIHPGRTEWVVLSAWRGTSHGLQRGQREGDLRQTGFIDSLLRCLQERNLCSCIINRRLHQYIARLLCREDGMLRLPDPTDGLEMGGEIGIPLTPRHIVLRNLLRDVASCIWVDNLR